MPAIAVAAIQIGDQWDTLPATIAQTSADAKPKNVECSRNIVELILGIPTGIRHMVLVFEFPPSDSVVFPDAR
ncbi:MAG: hypothetical protein WA215_14105 [Candidatus Cybelea sp.]|jgi:hypothetical protein